MANLPSVADNEYHLIAQITGTLADVGGDAAASAGMVRIAAPFIDLTGATAITKPANRVITAGQSFSYSVTFTNNGNVPADGPIAFTFGDSLNADGSSPQVLFPGHETPNLAPGASKTYTLTQKVPANFGTGIFYAVVKVDPSNTFGESDTTNNTAVSALPLAIVSALPDVVGHYEFFSTISKGPFKGEDTDFDLHPTHEDAAGNLTGTAQIQANDATFSGTVTAAGKVNITLVLGDVTTHIVATLNKKTDVLTGTFNNTSGSSGPLRPITLPGRLANTYTGTQTIASATTDLVIRVTADEPGTGQVSGTVDSVLGTGLAMTGTYSEATGAFTLAMTVPNGGTPYTVTYAGVELQGELTGTVTYNTVGNATGTFTAELDM